MVTTTLPFPRIEISLDSLRYNLQQIRYRSGKAVGIIAVVKDLAYGLGAVPIARLLEEEQVAMLAVAQACEAFELRKAGIKMPILVLGPAAPKELCRGYDHAISFAITDVTEMIQWANQQVPVRAHAFFDTGMMRMGISPDHTEDIIALFQQHPHIICEGLCTHFASADVAASDTVLRQHELFLKIKSQFVLSDLRPPYIHCANSAAILRHNLPGSTHIRPGILLYGCKPDPAQDFALPLRTIATLKSQITRLRAVGAGIPIGYGGTYVTPHPTTIATIMLGYAHGVPRALSNKGHVLINGRRYPIRGRVTMDYIMVDCGTHDAVAVGDEAVIMGWQGNQCIDTDELALQSNTIGYEILCGLSTRLNRYYYQSGQLVHHSGGHYF